MWDVGSAASWSSDCECGWSRKITQADNCGEGLQALQPETGHRLVGLSPQHCQCRQPKENPHILGRGDPIPKCCQCQGSRATQCDTTCESE